MGSLAEILAWCVAPLVFVVLPLGILLDPPRGSGFFFMYLLSPASIMAFNEASDLTNLANLPWVAVTVNFAAYGFILARLRKLCYFQADRLLGRMDADDSTEIRPVETEIKVLEFRL